MNIRDQSESVSFKFWWQKEISLMIIQLGFCVDMQNERKRI